MRAALAIALAISSCILLAGAVRPVPQEPAKSTAPSKDAAFYLPRRLNLTDEQQEKLRDLRRAYVPKLEALQLEADEILGPDEKKIADQARQKALENGKKDKQVHEAVLDALAVHGVPASVRAKYRRALYTQVALLHEIHQKKMALLTQEQRDQLKAKPTSPGGK